MTNCMDEEHEKYAGEVIQDPWEDPEQTDWKMAPEGGTDGLGTDPDASESPEPDQRPVPESE